MRSTFYFIIILLLVSTLGLAGDSLAGSNWISLNGSTSAIKPSCEVLHSNGNETLIRIRVPGFLLEELEADNAAYQRIAFPGCAGTLEVGKPELPVISELISVPGNTRVNVSIVDFRETVLDGYLVYPFQAPLREREQRVRFDLDRATYARNSYYPAERAGVGDPAIWRDLRVVDLRVCPIRFNPVTGELAVCREITVKVEYSGIGDTNVKSALRRPIAPNYERMYRSAVLNYDYLDIKASADLTSLDETAYDYLVIAADAYVANMAPFVNHKNSQGLATNIVPISQVGVRYGDIRDYIRAEYDNAGIRYVLLVGNESDIVGYKGYGFFSDYYYSLTEGDDDYADLAIGRFCVDNAAQVDNMVSKSIAFESNPPGGDWLGRSLLVANWEEAPGKYQQCKEEVRTAVGTQSGTYNVFYPTFTTAYGASFENGGDEASNADVVSYFNDGYRLINYRGHGDYDIWWNWNVYGEHFEIEDVEAIDNGQMTPVVFSIACLNADLSERYTTIAEAFTQGDDAAVAYLGATDPSYTYPNHDYDKQLYAAVFDEGINAVGDASNEASVRTIALWGSLGITNARMYLWLGDPSLQLIYQLAPPPAPPVLVSPDNGANFADPATVTFDWEDVSGAVSYQIQVDNESGFFTPLLINQEGIAESHYTPPQFTSGLYFWRVRATDGIRYGDWSEERSFSVGVALEAPVLLSPEDGERVMSSPYFSVKWLEVGGAGLYRVEIDNNADFSSPEAYTDAAGMCSNGVCVWQPFPPLRSAGTYYWRVRVASDNWPWSEVWSFRYVGGGKQELIEYADGNPREVGLEANYPNPFNPTTDIKFGLPKAGWVKLELFNIVGQRIATLVDGNMDAGYHTVSWDGTSAPSGVYLYRLTAGNVVETRKMLLVK